MLQRVAFLAFAGAAVALRPGGLKNAAKHQREGLASAAAKAGASLLGIGLAVGAQLAPAPAHALSASDYDAIYNSGPGAARRRLHFWDVSFSGASTPDAAQRIEIVAASPRRASSRRASRKGHPVIGARRGLFAFH